MLSNVATTVFLFDHLERTPKDDPKKERKCKACEKQVLL